MVGECATLAVQWYYFEERISAVQNLRELVVLTYCREPLDVKSNHGILVSGYSNESSAVRITADRVGYPSVLPWISRGNRKRGVLL